MKTLKSIRHILSVGILGFLLQVLVILVVPSLDTLAFHLILPGLIGFYAAAWSRNKNDNRLSAFIDGVLAVCLGGILFFGFVVVSGSAQADGIRSALEYILGQYIAPGCVYAGLGMLIAPHLPSLKYGSVGCAILFVMHGMIPRGATMPDYVQASNAIIPLVAGFLAGRTLLTMVFKWRALWEAMMTTALAAIPVTGLLISDIIRETCTGRSAAFCQTVAGAFFFNAAYIMYSSLFLVYGNIAGLPAVLIPLRKRADAEVAAAK